MHCTNCGNELKEGDKFCAKCGQTVGAEEAAPGQKQEGKPVYVVKNGMPPCLIIALVVLVMGLFIGGIVAAIAIPQFKSMLVKAREGATKGNLGALKSAISIHYGDKKGQWPKKESDIVPTYLEEMVPEKITGSSNFKVISYDGKTYTLAQKRDEPPSFITGEGGWIYVRNTGDVFLNLRGKDSKGVYYWKYGFE